MLKICLLISLIFITNLAGAQSWKTYPYHEEGTLIYFPQDEGRHPAEPTEWWYTNAFLTGLTTGNEYSVMLSYFYYPALGFDGFRIFNLADETAGQFFTEALPCVYPVMSQDHLNIQAQVYMGGSEQWTTLEDDQGNLIPFEYQLNATSESGSIDLTYASLKRPLMINDSGFVYQGAEGYSYYFSLTTLDVSGTLTLNGITEPVTGKAWIDRQYGTFNPSIGEQYEWFSLQLSNGMDLNIWELFTPQNSIPDTSTYRHFSIYLNDSTSLSSSDFTLERLQYIFMPDQEKCYSRQWHFVHDTIDLTFTTLHDNQEVMLPFRFYEGSLEVTGTVGSEAVTGDGFAELVHAYQHPEIEISGQIQNLTKSGSYTIVWDLVNPDDGRPLFYDVATSLNDSLSYELMAQHLTDTTWIWDNSSVPPGTPFWVMVSGYSTDTTLSGSDSTATALITGVLKPAGLVTGQMVKVYPNPVTGQFRIYSNSELTNSEFKLFNQDGKLVMQSRNFKGNEILHERGNLKSGIYYYTIKQGKELIQTGKLVFE
ncbi:MAG: lipocalin-like domain-containing protein [Lentimicrobium sp.]